jgi:cell division protein FtsN
MATAAATQAGTRPKPPADARDAKPSIVDKPKPTPEVAKPTAVRGVAAYSVQVAAYTKKGEAEKLVTSLVKRGYTARVDGDTAPFRVRIGRYASENEAEAALARIKAKHMEGFVVRAPQR